MREGNGKREREGKGNKPRTTVRFVVDSFDNQIGIMLDCSELFVDWCETQVLFLFCIQVSQRPEFGLSGLNN